MIQQFIAVFIFMVTVGISSLKKTKQKPSCFKQVVNYNLCFSVSRPVKCKNAFNGIFSFDIMAATPVFDNLPISKEIEQKCLN